MPRRFRALRSLALLVASTLVGPALLLADLLVTRDGATIETRGAWRVEGRRVIFTLPNGTLSSIRLDEVDLDASALATARAQEEAAAPQAPPGPRPPLGEPILRITEKDIPPMVEGAEESALPPGAVPAETPAQTTPPLEVVSWRKAELVAGDGVEILGTLRNVGRTSVVAPRLAVRIFASDGGLLATNEGQMSAAALAPGRAVGFRAPFPGIPDFASAQFEVSARGYRSEAGESEDAEELLDAYPDAGDAGAEVADDEELAEDAPDDEPPARR
jgi:hypothetical protein